MNSCCKNALGGWTAKGDRCERYNNIIPTFFDLQFDDEKYIRELIASGDRVSATKELIKVTGCGHRTAKILVAHPNGPNPKPGR